MTYGMPCDMSHMDIMHEDRIRAVGTFTTSDTCHTVGGRAIQKPLYQLFGNLQIDSVNLTAISKFLKHLNAY